MSEENTAPETSETVSSAESVEKKIAAHLGKVDAFVEKVIGLVGDLPWEKWLGVCNAYVGRFMPLAIALAGVLAFAVAFITVIRVDSPVSLVFATLAILVLTAFSMHLAPKALALTRSFVEKGEQEVMRPEFIYINKVLLGLGGVIVAVCLILRFDRFFSAIGLVVGLVAILSIIVFSNPGIVGVKAGYPQNTVEEVITLLMFPIKVVLALLTPVIGLAVVGGVVYGLVTLFRDGIMAATVLLVTALLPFLLPLAMYFLYLVLTFGLELYRAFVSLPRRLEDIRKAIAEK